MLVSDFHRGHEPMGKRPNIREELKRIRRDPLEPFLGRLPEDRLGGLLSSDVSRYREAHVFYYLAMRRYLENMSVAARFSNGPYWAWRSRLRFSPTERKLANRYKALRPYLEFDMANCLLHSRILLDRVTSLSRFFIKLPQQPSFTSFSDHKKFFQRQKTSLPTHEEYAKYIRENTEWFEMPLKAVRDKYLVHSASKHMRFMGMPNNHEVELTIMVPDGPDHEKSLSQVKVISVNALRMSYEIEQFLRWFCGYAGKFIGIL